MALIQYILYIICWIEARSLNIIDVEDELLYLELLLPEQFQFKERKRERCYSWNELVYHLITFQSWYAWI